MSAQALPMAAAPCAKSSKTVRASSVHVSAPAAMSRLRATARASAPVAAMTASRTARCTCSVEVGERDGVVMALIGPKGLGVS